MKKLLFSVLSLLMFCIGMKAQTNIANYKFASSVGTYVPLTGATTFLNVWDDQVSASIPLGGNFTYGAVTYTACFINANGYISFGGAVTGYTPLSTLSGTSSVISAFGRDGASSVAPSAAPSISYMNIGGATGEFVVEYKDHATYGGNGTERLNTQIRLDLATGTIKFVYGSWTAPAGATNAQVGIRGNTINWLDNVNSLTTIDAPTGTSCTWANAVNSNASSSTMLFSTANLAVVPSNGLTYTWSQPVNATLAPVRTFTAVTGIATTSATIGWTAPTGAAQYNIQYRTPGSCTWTNFSGNPVATNTATLTGLTQATIYQIRVQSNDGSNNAIWSHIPDAAGTGNGYSASGTFSTLPTCPATSNSTVTAIGSNTAVATWTVNGTEIAWDIFYGPTPLTAPTATSVPTATSSVNSFTFTGLNPVTAYAVYVRANCGSGDMSSWAGPRSFTTLALATDLQTSLLNAPAVSATGCYGSSIPVIIQLKNTGSSILDFATNNATVLTAITGVNPQSFTTTVNTGTLAANATLNVTVTATYNMSAAGVYTINASSTLATPDANTANDVMAMVTRTATAATALPYSQDFAVAALPAGWVNTNSWSFAANHGLTNNGIYKNLYSGVTSASFNLLKLGTVSGSESVTFDFRVLNYSSYPAGGVPAGNWGNVKVQVSTDCGATFATIGTIDNTTHTITTQAWSNKGFSLAAYAGQSVIIKVLGTWVAGDYFVDMDNFNIASCFPASAIAASNITTTTANIAWSPPSAGSPASYIWEVRTSGAAGSGTTGLATTGTVTAPSTSVSVSGLTASSNYTVYVISNCGGADVSNWASSTFTTLANCPVPTAYISTGITSTSATFTWTAGGSETAWDIFVGSNPTATTVPTATTSANSYTATGLSSPNTYSVYVRSNCGGSTSTWVLSTVTINYCTPAPTSVDGSGIINVTIAPTINNTTGAEVGNYGNYSAQIANATRSLPLTVNITYATGYTYDTKIWIDFNDDLDFNDVGEEVYSGASLAANPTTLTATFNVPLTAPLGTHRLRIGSQDIGPAIPCYTGSYGSYEDYSVNILPAPSCIPTSPITISAITPISAIATWTAAGTETAWDVYYGVTPLTAPTATTVPTTTSSATSYTMSGLTPSTGYNVYVRANCGSGDLSMWTAVSAFMTPCLPPNVLTTTGGISCGIGTSSLTATGDPGATLQWYANATGGSAIATGSVFTTPTITTTTNYYVSATGGLTTSNVGLASTTGANGTNNGASYLIFDAISNFNLNSVVVYPAGSGTGSVVIALQNSAGVTLQTATVAVTGYSTAVGQTVAVNFNVTPGTAYRLTYLSATASITGLYRESSGATFPYTIPGTVSITDGSLSGYYYYFYNWSVSAGCESTRSMVTATVTAPAVLSVTSGTTICANAIKTLSVTSTVGDFDSYTWTPNTYLYTDAAATTSYTGGTASTLYYSSSAISNTTYTINATNSVNGCANQTSTFMMSDMPVIYASVNPSVVCLSNSVTLTANTDVIGAGIVNVGSGSLATTASGSSTGNNVSPFSHYYGGYKAQYIIRASELTAAGLFAGNITSLSYSVTAAGITYTDFAIGIAATTQSVANTTFNGSAVVAYGPSSATPTVGLNTYNFTTPFNWDGTSNVVVAICWSNNNSGGTAAEVAYDATSFPSTSYARSDMQTSSAMCGSNTVSGTLSNRPLLIFAGQRNTPSVGTVNWTWNPGAIPTNTAIVTPTVAGPQSYTVTAVDPVTTCSNSAVVTVTVNAAPTLTATTSNTTVCAGSPATLTAMGTATSFTWTSGGNAMTTVVTPTAASVYTVTASTTGCSAITATVSVGVNAVPSVTATATSTLLCSNLGESAIVSWTDGVNTLTTSVTPTVATTYTFAINDGTCIGQTTIFIDVQTCTAVNSLVKSGAINIFPNPTNGILNIAISAELAGATSIELYDAVGKLVIKEALSNENTTINTSKLTDGMYFYKVINNNKAINIGKIVKH